MVKYFINEDKLTGKELWLAFIANELAEANRLKRIELHSMFVIENGRIKNDNVPYALDDSNDFEKDLKDQA